MPLGMEVLGLGPGNSVRWGPSSSFPKKGAEPHPQVSSHVYCDQTAGCIKITLGMEVGLSPGDFVLDGDQAPSPKRCGAPNFRPRLLWPNGCMDQDATWYGDRPRPTRHCVRWRPSSSSPKAAQPPICDQCPLWPSGWID